MLRRDLKNAIFNPYFLVCIVVATVLLIQSAMDNWGSSADANGLTGSLFYTCELGYIMLAIPILSALPFSESYYDEKHTGSYYSVIIRGNKKSYLYGKLFAAFVSGFLIMFLSCIVFEFVILIHEQGSITYGGLWMLSSYDFYAKMLSGSQGVIVLLAKILLVSAYGGIWGLFGMVASFFVHNRYIIAVVPFFAERFLMYFLTFLGIEKWHPYVITLPVRGDILDQMFGGIVFGVIYVVVFCLVMVIVANKRFRKQFE